MESEALNSSRTMEIRRAELKPINTTVPTSSVDDKEGEIEPLSPMGHIFHVPGLNYFIIAVLGCTTKIDVTTIKYGIKQTLIRHPRFSSKLMFDTKEPTKPVAWIRCKVNVEDHIVVPELDPNMESPDQFVEDYLSDLTKCSFDLSKPLWELHILNVKTSDAAALGVFKIHHSLGDGVSLISLLLACARKSSDPNALPTLPVAKKKPQELSSHTSIFKCFSSSLMMAKVLWNSVVDIGLFLATMAGLKDNNDFMRYGSHHDDEQQPPKRYVYKTFSFDDIKMVKNAMGMTVNDVVMGITQAGFSSYLNKKHGKDKGDENTALGNNLPKHIRLRAVLVMNLRPQPLVEGLAKRMESDTNVDWDWGNLVGYVLLPLHICIKEDPLDYIRDAKATIDRKKQSYEAQLSYSATKCLFNTLGLGVAVPLMHSSIGNTTLTFSNLVGPMEEISFYGHPMAFLAPSFYGAPQPLIVSFQSYMNKMTVVVAVDEDVIPDPHSLCNEIVESVTLVKNAIIKRKLDNF